MSLRFGCASIEITPPVGSLKVGWLARIEITRIADPLYARVAVLESGAARCAFIQVDVLSAPWKLVTAIRSAVSRAFGFTSEEIMVCATHNHAGPAVVTFGDVPRDNAYCAGLVRAVVDAFGTARGAMVPAELGFGRALEWRASFNRRMVARDGFVKTHGVNQTDDSLYLEGPIDPELAVTAIRSKSGEPIACLVNFALHPTYHGGDEVASANFPGVMARRLRDAGYPFALFLQGCSGDLHTLNPFDHSAQLSMEETGEILGKAAVRAIDSVRFSGDWTISHKATTLALPFRRVSEAEIRGEIPGAQRFGDPARYDRSMAGLLQKIGSRGSQPAQLQVFRVGDHAFVSLPGEIFVGLGLRIKMAADPVIAHPVSCANGMVGYVPHAAAFKRGGYETTFGVMSKLAPEAGEALVKAAIGVM